MGARRRNRAGQSRSRAMKAALSLPAWSAAPGRRRALAELVRQPETLARPATAPEAERRTERNRIRTLSPRQHRAAAPSTSKTSTSSARHPSVPRAATPSSSTRHRDHHLPLTAAPARRHYAHPAGRCSSPAQTVPERAQAPRHLPAHRRSRGRRGRQRGGLSRPDRTHQPTAPGPSPLRTGSPTETRRPATRTRPLRIPRHVLRRDVIGNLGTLVAACTPSRRGSASRARTAPAAGSTYSCSSRAAPASAARRSSRVQPRATY
jgi:hypothetical protein